MFQNITVAVVVPAYNEQKLIGRVIETMPDFIDAIIIVNDCSKDATAQIVQQYVANSNGRVVLIDLKVNQGVGGAIAAGYKWARDKEFDCAVVMAGDAQMNPDDLPALLEPIAVGAVDYSKGNRLVTGEAFKRIPKVRYFGNSALSMLTKIASGYWHVSDSQTGYTAINRRALKAIDWDSMYKRYGQPNDLLVSLNIANMRVCDVPVEPVYGVGEVSGINIRKAIFTIGWLLIKLFFKRMVQKYVIRDFHPLVFFYAIGGALKIACIPLFVRLAWLSIFNGEVPKVNLLIFVFASLSSIQFLLFAMWFDMEANRDLKVTTWRNLS